MLFSGLPFLYFFLPTVLIVYFLVPQKMKNGVLLVFSLMFYAWGEPKYVLLMLLSILIFYGSGLAIGKAREQKTKKWILSGAIAAGILLLGVFKYADFFLGSVNAVLGTSLPLVKLALPIGISFYTFQCMSYVVDVYRGNAQPQKNLISFGAYVSLFPQLIAGPIVRYTDVERELNRRSHSWENFALGMRRFLFGLGKKVLLANQFGELTEIFRKSGDSSVLFVWLYAIAFTLHIYFDFSGYSDMAIGLGSIFGFHFPENFNYPYLSGNITEFWRRWHMTLGGWFRDYVYIPMGGNRVSTLRWVGNILTVWMLTGLWHGANWNFVVWGLLFAVFLLMEKMIPWLKKLPAGLRQCYVMLVVILSFVIFNASSMTQALGDLKGMFAMAGLPAVSTEAVYYLRSYGVVFLLGVLGTTPWPKKLGLKLSGKFPWLDAVAMAVLLLICTAYLVDGSFNPFLYFRF